MSRPLVLASTSVYRCRLLDRLGLDYQVAAPAYAELSEPGWGPEETAVVHARAKAASLRSRFPGALIIGSDQVVCLNQKILGKPGTAAQAEVQLQCLAGREHRLLTALVVQDGEREETHLEVHRLRLRPLNLAQIREYLRRDAPLDCAGSYKIESLGVALMEAAQGDDPTAIEGLPLMALTRILSGWGLDPLG